MTSTADQNRRSKTRVAFRTQIILKAGEVQVPADAGSKDISMNGVFVTTEAKLPVGTPCEIEIVLTGMTTKLALNIKGVVTRQALTGLGIEFKAIGLDSYFHLRNILLYNTSDPEALEEELRTIT